MIRYRRRRSAKVNPSEDDAEAGDLYVQFGKLIRCEEPTGWGARNLGLLYPREIKPPFPGMIAVVKDGEIYWKNAIE